MNWHDFFLKMARTAAEKSKDPSTQTGCVVVRDNRVLSIGYNGFPQGVKDLPERYNDRPLKYKLIAHCDANAIYSAARNGVALNGATMYLTGPPCAECMKAIIQAGIVEVIWPRNNSFPAKRWQESLEMAALMGNEAGVKLTEYE